MNRAARTSRTRVPAAVMRILAILLLFAAASTGAWGQEVIVTGLQGLNFGSLFRSSSSIIPYNSTSAADFKITGRQGKAIRITVNPTDLWRSFVALDITVTNAQCAYSLNNGVTWTTFTTGTLFQDVTIPNGNNQIGTVRVRVGGIVTSTAKQKRGAYVGTITVNASYK